MRNRKRSSATPKDRNPRAKVSTTKQLVVLEKAARKLEPDRKTRNKIANSASAYVDGFIESQTSLKAYVRGRCKRLRQLTVGEYGKTFDTLLGILRDEVNHVGINSSSGSGFAYIPGGGVWTSAIADMLAAATNRYAGVYFSSPGSVVIENQMIRWLASVVGYPETAHGNLTSGGSIANLTAIQTARDSFAIKAANVRTSVIYSTAHVHHCIHKALHTTGLDEAIQRTIPMNSRYQMVAAALGEMLEKDRRSGLRPFLVIATAGTTDAGAIDPLDEVADLCQEYGAWFHVDAAYGGFFILVDQLKHKFKGIERSDSVVMDPHKGMFLPFGTGAALVKDSDKLLASYSHEAAYMQDAKGFDEISPSDAGPELTRHFRGLRMWLPLHYHGTATFRANLEEKYLLCKYFYDGVQRLGFETGPEPELSVALFRYPATKRDEFNKKLLNAVQDDGRCLFSSTVIDGEFWLRCAVLNFRTHRKEIDLALSVLEEKIRMMR